MTPWRLLRTALVVPLLLGGCGDETTRRSGYLTDAGPSPPDGGSPDAGGRLPDGGSGPGDLAAPRDLTPLDGAGDQDQGLNDAGAILDLGPDRDQGSPADGASPPDAGEGEDAAAPDASEDAGGGDAASLDAGGDAGGSEDAGGAGADGGVGPHPLVGTWATLQVHSALAEVPILGELRNETRAVQLVRITEEDGALQFHARTCQIEIVGASALVRTVIPDRFLASLGESHRALTVAGEQLAVPRGIELRGVRLDDPVGDPLPETAADPRVFDQDEDGQPGMTVRVTGLVDGEIYVIQRAWDALAGQLEADGTTIRGLVQWGDEQVILGTDNQLLAGGAPSRPDPEAARSHFQMLRLDGPRDCGWLAIASDRLFQGWRGPL